MYSVSFDPKGGHWGWHSVSVNAAGVPPQETCRDTSSGILLCAQCTVIHGQKGSVQSSKMSLYAVAVNITLPWR